MIFLARLLAVPIVPIRIRAETLIVKGVSKDGLQQMLATRGPLFRVDKLQPKRQWRCRQSEDKDDLYSTEAPEDSSPRNRNRLWDFLKLRMEKGLQLVTEKGAELDGEKIDIQWRDILDPTPENLLALFLTGLLGFAVLRIFWQLLLVAVTIVIAAFKYSVIAAILLALLVVFL